ncbi:hypothetical protein E2C01_096207 [Portunus trituberculatus]|uniref:Uncharacterized protein n=1 Tax=Portunus trituberculatus TaxID=210409 RepID=A0A5B7K266_PORTR|nr:hypothetical protein [Portunus trituberculatus]
MLPSTTITTTIITGCNSPQPIFFPSSPQLIVIMTNTTTTITTIITTPAANVIDIFTTAVITNAHHHKYNSKYTTPHFSTLEFVEDGKEKIKKKLKS